MTLTGWAIEKNINLYLRFIIAPTVLYWPYDEELNRSRNNNNAHTLAGALTLSLFSLQWWPPVADQHVTHILKVNFVRQSFIGGYLLFCHVQLWLPVTLAVTRCRLVCTRALGLFIAADCPRRVNKPCMNRTAELQNACYALSITTAQLCG